MAALKRCVPLLMVTAVWVGCTARADKVIDSPPKGTPAASALLLVDRWHAGVVIKVSDIPEIVARFGGRVQLRFRPAVN